MLNFKANFNFIPPSPTMVNYHLGSMPKIYLHIKYLVPLWEHANGGHTIGRWIKSNI